MASAAVEGSLATQAVARPVRERSRRRTARARLRVEPAQLSVHSPVPGRAGCVTSSGVSWPSRDRTALSAGSLRPLRASSGDDAPGRLSALRVRVTTGAIA